MYLMNKERFESWFEIDKHLIASSKLRLESGELEYYPTADGPEQVKSAALRYMTANYNQVSVDSSNYNETSCFNHWHLNKE